ncbi:Hypothetical protein R9X50_00539900 [Acrodontium crateriforme]|uniref:Uncharacterized protein n=1 Tax=Acrodontium crateriforme TaxID=150365 RepID=A0AAQ3R930_9PEZI|nr:Hypothetical protein R9X50_00539900 [Acrodontium crateriforme]
MTDSSGFPISPIRVNRPELTISPAAINSEPVELDSTPASPETVKRRGSKTTMLEMALTPEEQEKRAQLISERKGNPAVLVDIPQTPGPDQLERAVSSSADDETQIEAAKPESS